MIATINFMRQTFRRFNHEYFRGTLPTPAFQLIMDSSRLGFCSSHWTNNADGTTTCSYIIACSTYYDCPIVEVENTILHEMCHLWVFVNYPYTKENPHGPLWQSIAKSVTVASHRKYVITAKSTCDDLKVNDNVARKGYRSTDMVNFFAYRCKGYAHQGEWFCFACNAQAVGLFDEYVKRLVHEHKTNQAIYGRVQRRFLGGNNRGSFPLCRKRANGYFLSEGEFRSIYPHIKAVRQYSPSYYTEPSRMSSVEESTSFGSYLFRCFLLLLFLALSI
ncbi:MAG: SprT-like domain-containing protein [Bacteroidales bacterium]|nr:SprT-like domain-containing protein [Bacteroidales bacterium]